MIIPARWFVCRKLDVLMHFIFIAALAREEKLIFVSTKKQTEMKKIAILLIFAFSTVITLAQKDKVKETTTKPFVLGVIEEIQSKELAEKRIVNIYLPEGYNPSDSIKYPVIYLLDGSADEDFIHIVALSSSSVSNGSISCRSPLWWVLQMSTGEGISHFRVTSNQPYQHQLPVIPINSSHSLRKNYNHSLKRSTIQIPIKPLSDNRWADCLQRKY